MASNTTIPELIQGIRDMDRTLGQPKRTGLSKLRKSELIMLFDQVLASYQKAMDAEQAEAEAGWEAQIGLNAADYAEWTRRNANRPRANDATHPRELPDPADEQAHFEHNQRQAATQYLGELIAEDTGTDDQVQDAVEAAMVGAIKFLAGRTDRAPVAKAALENLSQAARSAGSALGRVAYSHVTAVVRSMGHTVRGKVVDTVLRQPGPDGTGRVCLVVQHDGHPTRRTLHALADVQFEALTS